MFTDYKIKWINNHIVIDDDQGLLVDTGSPLSFHSSGVINICGDSITVPTSLVNVTAAYLQGKISEGIQGIIGTDIISKHSILFNLHENGWNCVLMDDDAEYGNHIDSFSFMGIYVLYIFIEGKKRRMIFDTGAPVSYLSSFLVRDKVILRKGKDFSPLLNGDFNIDIVTAPASIQKEGVCFNFEFGFSRLIDPTLQLLGVDGIMGSELLKYYRLQIKGRSLILPPQGI